MKFSSSTLTLVLSLLVTTVDRATALPGSKGENCLEFTNLQWDTNRVSNLDCNDFDNINTYIDDNSSPTFITAFQGISLGDTYRIEWNGNCNTMTYVQVPLSTDTDFQISGQHICNQMIGSNGRICPGACTGKRRRHLETMDVLNKGTPVEKDDAIYQQHVDKCTAYDYTVSLSVDEHFVAFASPQDPAAIAADCPHVAVHMLFQDDRSAGKAQALVWQDEHDATDAAHHFADQHQDSSIHIGTFPATQLLQAALEVDEKLKAKNKNQNSSSIIYDAITNNCAGVMLDLASKLNIKVDARLTGFVAKRLLQNSSHQLMDRIRSSVNYNSLLDYVVKKAGSSSFLPNRKLRVASNENHNLDDEQVIQALVERTVANHA